MKTEPNSPFGLRVYADDQGDSLHSLPTSLLKNLISQYGLLIFKGFTAPNDDEYIAFSENFGEIMAWEFGAILELKISPQPANHIFTKGRVELHWDGAFVDQKPHFNIFHCIQGSNSRSGGQTLFVDTEKVLACASPSEIERWSSIQIEYQMEKKAHYGGTIQSPLIASNPFKKTPVIRYIEANNEDSEELNPMVVQLIDTPVDESELFLHSFTQRLYSEQFMYRHTWCAGDILIADNSCLLHGRSRYENNDVDRHIKRINII